MFVFCVCCVASDRGGRGGRRRRKAPTKKQEPHTPMWGISHLETKSKNLPFPLFKPQGTFPQQGLSGGPSTLGSLPRLQGVVACQGPVGSTREGFLRNGCACHTYTRRRRHNHTAPATQTRTAPKKQNNAKTNSPKSKNTT